MENILANIKFKNENILKVKIEYIAGDVNSDKKIIWIYWIKESNKLLYDDITQYFINKT